MQVTVIMKSNNNNLETNLTLIAIVVITIPIIGQLKIAAMPIISHPSQLVKIKSIKKYSSRFSSNNLFNKYKPLNL